MNVSSLHTVALRVLVRGPAQLVSTYSLLWSQVGCENIIAINSDRYSPQPLVIQGPAAGVPVTSTGLFADVLRLARTLAEWSIPTIT